MKTKTCCFAGHSTIPNKESVEVNLKKAIVNLIENYDVTDFYSGGKGEFDWLCANCINKLKNDYPDIKSYLILAYMPNKND